MSIEKTNHQSSIIHAAEGKSPQASGETVIAPKASDEISTVPQSHKNGVKIVLEEDTHSTSSGNVGAPNNGDPSQAPELLETADHVRSAVEDTRIHVDIDILDQLMNLTGELVLSRNRVVQLSTAEVTDQQQFRTVAQQLNTVVSELQETMLKTRMQPVQKVFGVLPRLIRDISKTHGKEIDLRMEGQETELDRTLIEAIKDPITHLVRNAIVHGIEAPDVRQKEGKPPAGTIVIHAYHEGGQVHIDIVDDGAGIDLQQVKNKALKEKLITPQQAEEMGERDLLNMIFRPGFSTATTVTSISGRGVGMDVVKKNLDRIGGIVDIHTEPQQGTTVKIRIPITLAIIPVLIVKSGNLQFAIPQVNLEELIMLRSDNKKGSGIETVYGAEVYRLRGELLPLLRLNRVLRLSSQETSEQKDINVVVVSAGTARFGIIVDEVGDTEEIVVKPLSAHVKQLPCYDGATIMGDGNIALILNMSGLFSAAQLNLKDIETAEQTKLEQEEQTIDSSSGDQQQSIVLFKTGNNEYYGVPMAFVVRLEEFPISQIETSGGREVMQYRNEILPLIRLEPYLDLPQAPDPDMFSLIVFSVEKQIGLMVHEVINTVEIRTQIDTETFQQKGVLGSTIVNGHSVLILDIHGLIELAYPTWYTQFFRSKLSDAERQQTRVLLVEDSLFFLNIEKSYFEAAGYQVLTATHGNEALEILEKQPVDVVVTDIDMPYCNGYELTKAIKMKEAWQQMPVMAVTALSGEEDRQKGIETGIDEYQIKLDRDEVLRALELLILRKRK